ncbi:LysR family transcriptional regulator [Paracoccus marinaquae]|uniref:LysR family transcriptional regulator n=1 Tax=Paracoccus marinaquae TaxID=2841926 RepID=A0ABS6ALS4_9RHOB|nr:LysR family transcriptional regulator [Paracoccus marinaquae]MBU3031545.1 LysR family transcriptional regulator [Paracoccus marinaquae]
MDLRRSDLGLLVSLDALLAERSVTAAARRLGISQPALSAQLARLRDLTGDELLVGNAHGMVPTPRAQEIQAPLHMLLQDISDLVLSETGFDPATSDRRFHLVAADLALATILPPLLQRFRDEAPGLRLTAGALDPARLEQDGAEGRVDLAVTTAMLLPQGFQSVKLIETEYRVIWRQDHPLLAEGITLAQFCALPHLHVSPVEASLQGPVDRVLQQHDMRRHVTASVSSYAMAPALIRASDLIGVVPRILMDFDGAGLTDAPLPVQMAPLSVFLGWHPRYRNDRAHRWLREVIAAICQRL